VRVRALRPLRSLRLEVRLDAATARRLRVRLVSARVLSFRTAGRRTVALVPSRRARRALRGARSVRLVVRSTVVARNGTAGRAITRAVGLRP
jgi:hypothetical protein